ncbi:MAG: hypothetical protein KGJ90_05095 [Patescibacteria group bacterium]|nr:hypothetical protein [Patescibacteria group bacterium]
MANPVSEIAYIDIPAGVTPSTDDTAFAAKNYTSSSGIRFRNGRPQKKGGNVQITFDAGNTISGAPRSEYSIDINGKYYQLIGTSYGLYVCIGTTLTNITPLQTSPTAAASSLSTNYDTLANNPISVTNGSTVVTVADTSASRYQTGDTYTLSGVSGTIGGVAAATLNAAHPIQSTGSNTVSFVVATTATSTASGGGNAVVRATGLLRMTVNNTMNNGDRVKVAGATDTGGIVAATYINKEFVIRNVSGTYFDFMTGGTATSSVSGGGGAGAEFYPQIAAGNVDENVGTGYGMGKYGVGLYGVSKTSSTARNYPQIWSFDRFGDYIMMTPGNGGGLYEWSGDVTVAPVLTANAPTAINYMFVTDNTVVVFGNGGTENRITSSDQGNRTVWSGTATNQYFDGTVSGADRLIGAIKLKGVNLIFTQKQSYTFQHIGLPNVWSITKLANVGMISQNAGWEAYGTAYWMGSSNFYMWNYGTIEIIPSNVFPQSSILKYVFTNLNTSQQSKCFAWCNYIYNEMRFHYPSASSNDPDSVAVCNLFDMSWWPDTESRVSVERPIALFDFPRMADINGNVYNHESGNDDNGSPLSFSLKTNLRNLGKKETKLSAFVPDSIQTGNISVKVDAYQWPNDTMVRSTQTYTVPTPSPRQNFDQQGRFWQYTISGNTLGQNWRMGQWAEERQLGGDGA